MSSTDGRAVCCNVLFFTVKLLSFVYYALNINKELTEINKDTLLL